MPVTLEQIVAQRRQEVAQAKAAADLAALRRQAEAHRPRGFRRALEAASRTRPAVIAELKKASPSKGVLRGSFPVGRLATALAAGGAAALSVLTEERHFQGSLLDMRVARKATGLPVLRKDFIVDPWQVWEARATDADSFLLIVAILEDAELSALLALGRDLGMEPLIEVHTRGEVSRAVEASARILGVNNRDLRTLDVHPETSLELMDAIPDDCIAVSESGLRSREELERLRAAGFDAFLIGEHLMQSPDPAAALGALLGRSACSR